MKKVTIHTDGGCQGNPGPGGWAAVLRCGEHKKELSGGAPATTNNRMELQAAVEALSALKFPCEVDFYTDSQYMRQGITTWLFSWKRNGWMTKDKQPVKNEDLWRALDAATARHKVNWKWVKGHAGNAGNERCDQLAAKQMSLIRKTHTPEQLKTLLKTFQASQSNGGGGVNLPFRDSSGQVSGANE